MWSEGWFFSVKDGQVPRRYQKDIDKQPIQERVRYTYQVIFRSFRVEHVLLTYSISPIWRGAGVFVIVAVLLKKQTFSQSLINEDRVSAPCLKNRHLVHSSASCWSRKLEKWGPCILDFSQNFLYFSVFAIHTSPPTKTNLLLDLVSSLSIQTDSEADMWKSMNWAIIEVPISQNISGLAVRGS